MMKDPRLEQFESFDDADNWAANLPIPPCPEPKPEPKEEKIDPRVKRMTQEQFDLYEKVKHIPEKRVRMLLRPAETLAAYKAYLAQKAQKEIGSLDETAA